MARPSRRPKRWKTGLRPNVSAKPTRPLSSIAKPKSGLNARSFFLLGSYTGYAAFFNFAQRAFCAATIFLRAAMDMTRPPGFNNDFRAADSPALNFVQRAR